MNKEQWHKRNIFNSSNLASMYAEKTGKVGLYLGYSSNDGSRASTGTPTGYQVIRPGFRTDTNPNAHWIDRGHMTFSVYSGGWDAAFANAVAWCADTYGYTEFVAIPGFGRDRFPKQIATWAKSLEKEVLT